jgi:hypothetical protein
VCVLFRFLLHHVNYTGHNAFLHKFPINILDAGGICYPC